MSTVSQARLFWLAAMVAAGLCNGCGSASTMKATPDFSFSANVAALAVTAGGSPQQVTLTATALNGFSGTIGVSVSGLPPGVSASPATLSLTPGTPQQVGLAATATASAGSATAQFTASS